jgi:putative oxidoreductase
MLSRVARKLSERTSVLHKLMTTDAPRAVILIRIVVGVVFVSEGIQKFLFPGELGVGRFEKIGIPSPELFAPLVATTEISGGLLLLLGFMTRPAASLLVCVMSVAIVSTKVPILLRDGFWKMAHESRTDWSVLMSLIFLIVVGAGSLSIDAKLTRSRS